jgi:hypothetical protein
VLPAAAPPRPGPRGIPLIPPGDPRELVFASTRRGRSRATP